MKVLCNFIRHTFEPVRLSDLLTGFGTWTRGCRRRVRDTKSLLRQEESYPVSLSGSIPLVDFHSNSFSRGKSRIDPR